MAYENEKDWMDSTGEFLTEDVPEFLGDVGETISDAASGVAQALGGFATGFASGYTGQDYLSPYLKGLREKGRLNKRVQDQKTVLMARMQNEDFQEVIMKSIPGMPPEAVVDYIASLEGSQFSALMSGANSDLLAAGALKASWGGIRQEAAELGFTNLPEEPPTQEEQNRIRQMSAGRHLSIANSSRALKTATASVEQLVQNVEASTDKPNAQATALEQIKGITKAALERSGTTEEDLKQLLEVVIPGAKTRIANAVTTGRIDGVKERQLIRDWSDSEAMWESGEWHQTSGPAILARANEFFQDVKGLPSDTPNARLNELSNFIKMHPDATTFGQMMPSMYKRTDLLGTIDSLNGPAIAAAKLAGQKSHDLGRWTEDGGLLEDINRKLNLGESMFFDEGDLTWSEMEGRHILPPRQVMDAFDKVSTDKGIELLIDLKEGAYPELGSRAEIQLRDRLEARINAEGIQKGNFLAPVELAKKEGGMKLQKLLKGEQRPFWVSPGLGQMSGSKGVEERTNYGESLDREGKRLVEKYGSMPSMYQMRGRGNQGGMRAISWSKLTENQKQAFYERGTYVATASEIADAAMDAVIPEYSDEMILGMRNAAAKLMEKQQGYQDADLKIDSEILTANNIQLSTLTKDLDTVGENNAAMQGRTERILGTMASILAGGDQGEVLNQTEIIALIEALGPEVDFDNNMAAMQTLKGKLTDLKDGSKDIFFRADILMKWLRGASSALATKDLPASERLLPRFRAEVALGELLNIHAQQFDITQNTGRRIFGGKKMGGHREDKVQSDYGMHLEFERGFWSTDMSEAESNAIMLMSAIGLKY